MSGMRDDVVISQVRADAVIERLGVWRHARRELELVADGFPLLGCGTHHLEGELPWIFWDMCPSGYLGRRIARHPRLAGLPSNPTLWTATEVLQVLQLAGGELSGNLLIGEQAIADFQSWRHDSRTLGVVLEEALRDAATEALPSSLGGERPKLLMSRFDGSGYLMKFSPPPLSPQGQRWADLLRVEALCARTLREEGVPAVQCSVSTTHGRTTLHVDRFDRLRGRGRVGTATFAWLSMDRWGEAAIAAPEVARRLHEEGVLGADDAEQVSRLHAFSAAIGNNDAHLGNYSLLFDERGRARLAPSYDVLPMAFAPRNDELPDAYLSERTAPEDGRIAPWVSRLASHVVKDDGITEAFRERWLRWVGRIS